MTLKLLGALVDYIDAAIEWSTAKNSCGPQVARAHEARAAARQRLRELAKGLR